MSVALLEGIANWLDELRAKLGDARHTMEPRAFKMFASEVETFKRVCFALADFMRPPDAQ
jgi:hypothetical protein